MEDRILLEQGDLVVVDKPPDLPTSGRSLDDPDCLQYWLMRRHAGMVWVVHQLDADTSGVNLFVTRKPLVDVMHRRLRLPDAEKRYLAFVHGVPDWDETNATGPIGKISARSLGVTSNGRSAHSHFAVVQRGWQHSLIEARIFTGRTHQIRIHLAHLGHPVVGEEWYVQPPCAAHPRQALHARRLKLPGDPELDVTAPVPADLRELAARLGLSEAV